MTQHFDPEKLRPAEYVCEPDPRNKAFVRIDRADGTCREIDLADHHEQISGYILHTCVPEDIVLQFETAKNVYLYAWFVYRFYQVAEHQSLACLELALRKRLKEEIKSGKIKGKRPTLRPLLEFAIDNGLIRNEGFATWRNRGEINSRERVRMEKFREMSEKGLTEVSWDESSIEITEEDLDWDYVKMLPDVLSKMRNAFAHGSTELNNWAHRSIQIVCEMINQLYAVPEFEVQLGSGVPPGPR